MFKKISEALGIKQNILICCYGKLPIYKDFIFIGTDAREAYHFKEWMDKGFGGEWNENLSATSFSPHRILMTFPQQRNVVVASIWDSFDMGGLRRFPFAIFVMLPRNVFINSLSCFLPVWEYMEKCYSSMEEIKNISEFYNKYRGLTMEMNGINKNIFLKTLQDEKMKVLIDGLFKENNEECWANLLQDILTVFSLPQMLKNRDPEIALRLPLACLMNIPIQVESWMRFIKQNFPQPLPIPTLFFPQQDATAFSILWRAPRQEDVQLLGKDIGEYEYILDLTQSRSDGSGDLTISIPETLAEFSQSKLMQLINREERNLP